MSHRRLVRLLAGVSTATLVLITAGPALACFTPPPCSGISISTKAQSGIVGQAISDVATVKGGDNPSGSITWTVYSSSDTWCSKPVFTTTPVTVDGNGNYTSPTFTPTSTGNYQWVATYSGDRHNASVATKCNDSNEQSVVSKASPGLTTTAAANTVGQPIQDTAVLSGGYVPGGSITWKLYTAGTDCSTPLFTSAAVPVSGAGTYDSPSYTPQAAGTYQWVATYSGDANNTAFASACNDTSEQSVVQVVPAPGISVVKLQRDGSSGPFTTATIPAKVGDTLEYEIQATNAGNTTLALGLNDPLCDPGTIMGPYAISGTITGNVLSAGGVAQYTCSHVLTASDASPFTNTATVIGLPPSGPAVHGTASVTATKQAISPIKIVRCAKGMVKKTKKAHGKTVTVCVPKHKVRAVVVRRRVSPPSFTG